MRGKILLTGSKGFIGKKLAEKLSQNNDVEGFDLIDGMDLRNLKQVREAVEGKTAVFHLAAVADLNWSRTLPIDTMEINIQGTWNIAYACCLEGVKLHFSSTECVYGNQKVHPVTEETLPNPSEIYACSKLAGENVIKGFHFTYGLQYNLMRFATIYGEGTRPALATHIFLGEAIRGEPIMVHGDGSQTRTLTHVDDLVEAILALYNSGKINDIWNMNNEEEISALQMAQDIKDITKSESQIMYIPQRIGQTYRESVSANKMLREVGWKAKINWLEGINRMYLWFMQSNQIVNKYTEPK